MCNFYTLCYSAIVFLWVAAARHNLKLVIIKHVNVAIKGFKTTFVMVKGQLWYWIIKYTLVCLYGY